MLEGLLVGGVQQDMACPVGGVAGARGAVPAEATLGDAAVRRAAEDAAHVLVLVHDLDGVLDHDLDGVLVAQPVGAFDRVEHVLFPAIVRPGVGGNLLQGAACAGIGNRADVAQRGGDAALGSPTVRAQRMDLGDHADVNALLAGDHRCPGSGETGAHNDHVMGDDAWV